MLVSIALASSSIQSWNSTLTDTNSMTIDNNGNIVIKEIIYQRSVDGVLWACRVTNAGAFECNIS